MPINELLLKQAKPRDPDAVFMRVSDFPGEGFVWNYTRSQETVWMNTPPNPVIFAPDTLIEVKAAPQKIVPVTELTEDDIRVLLGLLRTSKSIHARVVISGKLAFALEAEGLLEEQY